jgi:mannose/fructose-specific phosphotransferase system component IIA
VCYLHQIQVRRQRKPDDRYSVGDVRTEDDQGDWVCLVKGDEGGDELGRFMEANIRLDDAKAICDVWGGDPWSRSGTHTSRG